MSAFAITLFTRAICADGVERVEASSALGSFSGWPELSGFAFTAPSGPLTKLVHYQTVMLMMIKHLN